MRAPLGSASFSSSCSGRGIHCHDIGCLTAAYLTLSRLLKSILLKNEKFPCKVTRSLKLIESLWRLRGAGRQRCARSVKRAEFGEWPVAAAGQRTITWGGATGIIGHDPPGVRSGEAIRLVIRRWTRGLRTNRWPSEQFRPPGPLFKASHLFRLPPDEHDEPLEKKENFTLCPLFPVTPLNF